MQLTWKALIRNFLRFTPILQIFKSTTKKYIHITIRIIIGKYKLIYLYYIFALKKRKIYSLLGKIKILEVLDGKKIYTTKIIDHYIMRFYYDSRVYFACPHLSEFKIFNAHITDFIHRIHNIIIHRIHLLLT